MARKDKDSSDSSSEGSDDSRSSSPSPRSRSDLKKKKKDSKISSSKHHDRKSRKSYKHRDDKKKKRRRSSSSSSDENSRSRSRSSRSASKSRQRNRHKSKPHSKSRERREPQHRDHRDHKKPQEKSPEKPPQPEKSQEDIEREKERKRQIRLAKLRALKYEKEDETTGKESPILAPAVPEKVEPEETKNDDLVDSLELDNDDDKSSRQEQPTPKMKPQTSAMEEEEIDPLDAYMNEIEQVAKKQVIESWDKGMEATGYTAEPAVDQSKVITFEDLQNLYQRPSTPERTQTTQRKTFVEDEVFEKPNGSQSHHHDDEEMQDEQDDQFYKAFIAAMKKKDTKKPVIIQKDAKEDEKGKKKVDLDGKGEILDDDLEGDYMAFREDNDPDQDFLAKQKKQAERKELKTIDHADIEYEPFRKNFYIESREIGDMSREEVEQYRKDLGEIQVRGKDCPKPIKTWYQCGLSDAILGLINKRKYEFPFPIQCQALPAIMSGRDVIGVAETGSGKTLAYVLPMLRHIKDQRPLAEGDGPVGLIMAPTRELAWQIYTECKAFAKVVGMNVACVYGGAGVQGQIADLKRGAEIVVCTPGRMIDVLSTSNGKITNLRRVSFVVLDEADRMLDFGFEPQIGRILAQVRPDRQTAMFSATFPRNVEALAKKVLTKPVEIIVGTRGKISSNVEQIIEVIDEDNKFLRLLKILGDWSEKGSILIFVNKQTDADNLFKELLKFAYYPLVLHGGQDPDDRENTIQDFKKGVRTLMVATSVCARGLDIKSLVLVVNYQCAQHKEDYIHRIGRTGRAGNKGTAITFITPEEDQYAFDLITALRMSSIEPPQELIDLAEDYKKKVEKGEAKFYANKNLAGRGHKFDKKEKEAVKQTKQALKRQFGLELNMSDDESDEEIITSKEIKSDKDNQIDEAHIKKMLKDPNTRTAVTRAAEKAAKDAILAGASSEGVLQAAHNAIRSILSQYKGSGLERAAELVGEIEGREDESNERVSADLEINDYPQSARHKVTQKDFLGMIHDLTNCTVNVRGTYFEAGKKVPTGQRKLRLHIVGEDKYEVESAYREIRRVLDEASVHALNTVSGMSGGKFTI